jgi:hypothetical protein
LVCADEVDLLAAIEALTRQTLERNEEEGFEPDHRVPMTGPQGAIIKKPKKPKKPKVGAATSGKAVKAAKGIAGNWIDYAEPSKSGPGRRRPSTGGKKPVTPSGSRGPRGSR